MSAKKTKPSGKKRRRLNASFNLASIDEALFLMPDISLTVGHGSKKKAKPAQKPDAGEDSAKKNKPKAAPKETLKQTPKSDKAQQEPAHREPSKSPLTTSLKQIQERSVKPQYVGQDLDPDKIVEFGRSEWLTSLTKKRDHEEAVSSAKTSVPKPRPEVHEGESQASEPGNKKLDNSEHDGSELDNSDAHTNSTQLSGSEPDSGDSDGSASRQTA